MMQTQWPGLGPGFDFSAFDSSLADDGIAAAGNGFPRAQPSDGITRPAQPDANGVTWNQSATVRANFDQDAVTMNRDGSFHVYDDGRDVRLGKGESATLSGGETVSENQDGSLLVSARSATGGTIATTLRATGQGVDVSTHAHEIAVGGDALAHAGDTAPIRRAPHVPPPEN